MTLPGGPMPRPPRKPHELKLRNHHGRAVCTYRGHTYTFGVWDLKNDRPAAEARDAFHLQVGAWEADPDAGVRGPEGDLLWEVWLDWLDSPRAPADRRLAATAESLLFGGEGTAGRFAATAAGTLTPADLLAWQSWVCGLREVDGAGEPTGRQRFGRRMVLRLVGLVKRCYAWAAVTGRVDPDRAAAIRLVPGPAKGEARPPARVPAVPDGRVELTLARLPPPVAAAVRVLRLCGARPAEVLGLRAGDVIRSGVCWAAGTVPLDLDAIGVWAAVKAAHKNSWRGDDRVIFFGPQAQAVLLPLLGDDPAAPLFRPADGRAHAVAVNKAKRKPGSYGTYKKPKGKAKRLNDTYSADSLNQAVGRACDAAGVPRWTPKQLRKTCLGFVQARFGAEVASAVGGHAAVGVTQRSYTGSDFAAAARAMAELG